MKIIAYLVALIYAHQAIAGLPPTKLGGQSGTAFTNFNFLAPANQATKVTGGGLIETGNRNLLINGEFEAELLAGPSILGWSETGTATPQDEATFPIFGKKSLRFLPSLETIILTQDVTQSDALDGANAQIKFSAVNTAASVSACVRQNGTTLSGDSNCVTLATDGIKRDYVIPTKFGTNSTGVSFASPATTGTLIIDSVELGDRLDVSDVQQARLLGTLNYAATANCAWSTTSTTAAAFAADPDCPTPTVTGEISAPGTKIPAFVIPAGVTGSIQVVTRGQFAAVDNGASAQDAIFSFNDGTTTTNIGRLRYSDGDAVGSDLIIPNLSFGFSKTSSSAQTIQIYGQVIAANQSASINASTVPLQFDIYYYPPANKIFTTDSLGWFIDANIGGANPDLGVANVATYTEITNAGLDLVVNTAKGSQSAKILRSGTNPPTGTTCAAGNESVGLAFTIPKAGQYEVCAEVTHNAETTNTANSGVNAYFQLIETPTNAQTNSQLGSARLGSTLASINATTAQSKSSPISICSIFNFSSAGEKAVRLMYEQIIGVAAPNVSLLLADRSAASGQRDIHFTVKPAINLERINGSFAQIEDALEEVYVEAHTGSAAISFPNGTDVAVVFGTEVVDTAGAYNPATGVFTAPIAGNYCISSAILNISPGTTGRFIWRANFSTAADIVTRALFLATGAETVSQISFCQKMALGETLFMEGAQNSGSTVNATTSGQLNNWLRISRIPTP